MSYSNPITEEQLPALLADRHNRYLQWEEPYQAMGPNGERLDAHMRLTTTVHDCIGIWRKHWDNMGIPYKDADEEILAEFVTVNWAYEVETSKG